MTKHNIISKGATWQDKWIHVSSINKFNQAIIMATQHKGAINQQNIYPKIIIKKKKNTYMHILNFNTT